MAAAKDEVAVVVTYTAGGYETTQARSDAVEVGLGTLADPGPSIGGSVKVGKTVEAEYSVAPL